MQDLINQMLEAFENPAKQHAAIVHLPIGLTMIGVVFALLTALVAKSKALRWSAVLVFIVLAFSAWLAMQSGEEAHSMMTRNQPTQAHDIVGEHEEMAEKVWFIALVTSGLFALSAFPTPILRHGAAWLGVLAAVFLSGWVAVTGHYGGTAVYDYAVGTANPMTFDDPALRRSPPEVQPDQVQNDSNVDAPAIDTSSLTEREAFFVANVLPILETSCQRCHNPRRAGRSGKLDQTSLEAILHGGRSGPALVPGNPEESLIYQRVATDDEEIRMPPSEALKPEEIEAIRQWIADGAVWVVKEGS